MNVASDSWYAAASRFLGGFPDRLLVLDTETTGLEIGHPNTVITQLGWAVVAGGRRVDNGSVVLNWSLPGPARMAADVYRGLLAQVAAAMAARGATYRVTWEMVERDGVEPTAALAAFRDLTAAAQGRGWPIAGHNIFRFDRPLLEHAWRKHGEPLAIDVERLVDSGLLEKCRQMGHTPPLPGECLRADWYEEVAAVRSRVRWKLDGICADEYRLFERVGAGDGAAHDAGFDCLLCAALLDAMRDRAALAAAA